ncbi:Uma2 family endonuclease [Rippkaea orientalis]|uniref:Uma2 family endonuclease n=1 Tax=Rippkaea orientalis TaxID=2546366 RepID=UPI0002D54728|nr:Uma2 family endonuclease [Rippkaea orientalis]
MVQNLIKTITLEKFLQLPETKPANEFVDGKISQKVIPQAQHNTLHLDLGSAINVIVKPQHIARAYSKLRYTFGNKSIVPDILVFVYLKDPTFAVFEDKGNIIPVPSFA